VLIAAIEALESYADGILVREQLQPSFENWYYMTLGIAYEYEEGVQLRAEAASAWLVAFWAFSTSGNWVFNYVAGSQGEQEGAERDVESCAQVDLLRHIIGNPLRPYPAPPSWPSAVIELAEATYAGEDCSFALHDALLEAGHPELAEHFKDKDHPKGCFAVDLILGKR